MDSSCPKILDFAAGKIFASCLHEAIHAEMRRYLFGATDTSTLPGFLGDFATDWKLFIEESYGKDIEDLSDAEHEAMVVKYHNLIVEGLKEFGDPSFSPQDYESIG